MNETPSQTIGPFFRFALDWLTDTDGAAGGSEVEIRGVVYDGDGTPVPDAMIECWADPHFARALTEADGSYRIVLVKPAGGPEGAAPHVEMCVFARGLLQRLATRVYFADEPEANAADPVLARVPEQRRNTLVAEGGDGSLVFDVHLQGPRETVFFAY